MGKINLKNTLLPFRKKQKNHEDNDFENQNELFVALDSLSNLESDKGKRLTTVPDSNLSSERSSSYTLSWHRKNIKSMNS